MTNQGPVCRPPKSCPALRSVRNDISDPIQKPVATTRSAYFFVPDFSGDHLAVFIFSYALLLTVFVPRHISTIWSVAFEVTHSAILMIALSIAMLFAVFKRPLCGLLTTFEPRNIRSISLTTIIGQLTLLLTILVILCISAV